MKKRVLSMALCVCMSAMLVTTGCTKKTEKKEESSAGKSTTIAAEDDNVEALHKILLDKVGDTSKAKLDDYSKLEIEVAEKVEITDELFQEQLDMLLEEYPYTFTGEVVSGESVNIDYEGSLDGELFDGGSGEGYDLTIGSGAFIPGFEEQLIGMKVGDTKTIDVTFPETYENNPDLAGKLTQFKVTVNYRTQLEGKAELNDQWVSAYLESSDVPLTDATVDGFKAYFRESLQMSADSQRENGEKSAAYQKLLDMIDVSEVEDSVKENYRTVVEDSIKAQMESYNMTLDEYLTQIGMTEDEYNTELDEWAEDNLKTEYLLVMIGEKEKLAPTEEEYTAFLQEYADSYGMELEDFRTTYQSQYQMDLYMNAYLEKILDKLLKDAVIKDIKADSDGNDEATGDAVE